MKDDEVAPAHAHQLPVATAQGRVRPPAILHQPRLAHRLDPLAVHVANGDAAPASADARAAAPGQVPRTWADSSRQRREHNPDARVRASPDRCTRLVARRRAPPRRALDGRPRPGARGVLGGSASSSVCCSPLRGTEALHARGSATQRARAAAASAATEPGPCASRRRALGGRRPARARSRRPLAARTARPPAGSCRDARDAPAGGRRAPRARVRASARCRHRRPRGTPPATPPRGEARAARPRHRRDGGRACRARRSGRPKRGGRACAAHPGCARLAARAAPPSIAVSSRRPSKLTG